MCAKAGREVGSFGGGLRIFVLFEMGGLGEMGDLCDFVGLMYESYRSVVCGL